MKGYNHSIVPAQIIVGFAMADFENYRPHFMDPDPHEPGKFVIYRMCPPNRKVNFFFSDPTQPILYYSKNYPYKIFKTDEESSSGLVFYSEEERSKRAQKSPNKLQSLLRSFTTRSRLKKFFKLQYLDTTIIEFSKPTLVNSIQTLLDTKILSKADYEPLVIARPRDPETYYPLTQTNKWTFAVSLFRTYVRDSPELIDSCFETDWADTRLDKLTGKTGDVALAKAALKKFYPSFRNVYKYYASIGMLGDIPAITQNQYSSILNKSKILGDKVFKNSAADINFVTCNSNLAAEKNYRNPDKALVRHEFLEALGRIAIEKYTKNNSTPATSQEAFQALLVSTNFIENFQEVEDPQQWRDTRYWNEECDLVLKRYLEFVKQLWETWADSKKTEKRYFQNFKTMNIFEFAEMVKTYDLLDECLTEREINIAFNLAMMTQENEITSDRFIQMTFVEFMEALARLAERKSKVPLGDNPDDYSLEEKKGVLLYFKLESMLDEMQEKQENLQSDKKGGNSDAKRSQNFIIKKNTKHTGSIRELGIPSQSKSPDTPSSRTGEGAASMTNKHANVSLFKGNNPSQPISFKQMSKSPDSEPQQKVFIKDIKDFLSEDEEDHKLLNGGQKDSNR